MSWGFWSTKSVIAWLRDNGVKEGDIVLVEFNRPHGGNPVKVIKSLPLNDTNTDILLREKVDNERQKVIHLRSWDDTNYGEISTGRYNPKFNKDFKKPKRK